MKIELSKLQASELLKIINGMRRDLAVEKEELKLDRYVPLRLTDNTVLELNADEFSAFASACKLRDIKLPEKEENEAWDSVGKGERVKVELEFIKARAVKRPHFSLAGAREAGL